VIAYATFARSNDLGNGLVVYPVSAALLTLIANGRLQYWCARNVLLRREAQMAAQKEQDSRSFFFSGCYNGHVTSR